MESQTERGSIPGKTFLNIDTYFFKPSGQCDILPLQWFHKSFLNMKPPLFIACLQDLRGLVCLHEYCTRLPTSPCHKKPISLLLENMNMYLTWTLEIYRSLGTEIPKRFDLRVPRFFELSTRFLGDLFVTWLVRHLFQPTSVNLLRSISS